MPRERLNRLAGLQIPEANGLVPGATYQLAVHDLNGPTRIESVSGQKLLANPRSDIPDTNIGIQSTATNSTV